MLTSNPFAQLINPEAVLAAHERFGARGNLPRQVYKQLDRPQIHVDPELARFDAAVDAGRRAPRPSNA